MPGRAGMPWLEDELEAVVTSYMEMLRAELQGKPYVKADFNLRVRELTGRTHGSVERKFQNIGAVMIGFGAYFVDGYKPLSNVQNSLRETVRERLLAQPDIEQAMLSQANHPLRKGVVDISWTTAPKNVVVPEMLVERDRSPFRTDFVKLDAHHRALGLAGEEAVVHLERKRLASEGFSNLARKVEHVSVTKGDGLGYDVLSFKPNGDELFIEVKTTRRGRGFPFWVSRNEVDFSAEVAERFQLYRVFDFDRPKMGVYSLAGALASSCQLSPTEWQAWPA